MGYTPETSVSSSKTFMTLFNNLLEYHHITHLTAASSTPNGFFLFHFLLIINTDLKRKNCQGKVELESMHLTA